MRDAEAELDEWEAIEARTNERAQTLAGVLVALRFSEAWRVEARAAEEALLESMRRCERAKGMLDRTTAVLEQAVRLHSMGRT